MTDLPIACTLTPGERATRGDELLPDLAARAVERREIAGGYSFRFGPDAGTLERMTRAVIAERQCCRFLAFRITAEADAGPIWLDVTGPEGTREFLEDLLRA